MNGVSTNPYCIADEKGNCSVLYTVNNDWTEEIGRAITTACGGQVTTLASPMSGVKMKESVVVGTVDYAQHLGRVIRTAVEAQGETPEEYFLRESGALRFFKARSPMCCARRATASISAAWRWEGIGEDKGRACAVEFQNENIYAEVGRIHRSHGARPHLPRGCRDVHSGYHGELEIRQARAGGGPSLRRGVAHAAGLALAGPAWFGLESEYVPLEERCARKGA